MRFSIGGPMLHETLREMHRALASLLLSGAMLAPVVEAWAGWSVHTPLGVPLLAHVCILATLGVVTAVRATAPARASRDLRRARWLLVPPLAVAFTAILHSRANGFYTETALIEGMAVLFVLRVGIAVLRGRALRRLELAAVDRGAPFWWRHGAEWRNRLRTRGAPAKPAVRLADALTLLVGWLLLTAWMLIALAHRHLAGPLLLLTGAIEMLALFALVPDALAGRRPLAPPKAPEEAHTDGARALVRHAAPSLRARTFVMLWRQP